jgi:isoprenylcysteine carboxyl methyltransferase (ICMT) family protein YpbQ
MDYCQHVVDAELRHLLKMDYFPDVVQEFLKLDLLAQALRVLHVLQLVPLLALLLPHRGLP